MVLTQGVSERQKNATMKIATPDSIRLTPNLNSIRQSLPLGYALVAVDERGNIINGTEQVKGNLELDTMRVGNQLEQLQRRSDRVSNHGASITETKPDECNPVSRIPATFSVETRGRRMVPEHGRRRRRAIPANSTTPARTRPSSFPATVMPEVPVAALSIEPRTVKMTLPPQKQMKSFRIDDHAAVVDFLTSRLKLMQQVADKKIAKAWIKGICPKKQAKFPYQNNKEEKATGKKPDVPGWWPDTETVCRFVEPDHIRREERVGLCLHLLRLRPSPAQLAEWDIPQSARLITRGWTEWLKELAGPEVFEEVSTEGDHRVKHRQKLMEQMYDVAQQEQDYLEGSIDGWSRVSYEEEEVPRAITSKRTRSTSSAASTPVCEDLTPRSASSSCTRVIPKRPRRESIAANASAMERCDVDLKPDLEMVDAQNPVPLIADQDKSAVSFFCESFAGTSRNSVSCGKGESNMAQGPRLDQPRPPHHRHGLPHYNGSQNLPSPGLLQPPLQQWHDRGIPAFNEQQQQGDRGFQYQAQLAPNTFPGRQDFEIPQFEPIFNNHQVNMSYVPQSEFQATPGTPVFSPAGMVSMPMDNFSTQQQCGVTTEQQFAMMAPSQFFQPAQPMESTVADFHPPTVNPAAVQYQHPYQQEPAGLAQHLQQQQIHGMPGPMQWHHHHTRR